MAGHDNIPTLAEQVSRVPTQPGCYLWKDAKGDVIYVGKAKNLRARMRQYVTLQDERQKIPLMMQLVASFDYIVVETEHEALVLERNLIGQYHPYFNVDLKDDKSYPFIASAISPARAILAPIPIAVRRARPSIRCARLSPFARHPVRSGVVAAASSSPTRVKKTSSI